MSTVEIPHRSSAEGRAPRQQPPPPGGRRRPLLALAGTLAAVGVAVAVVVGLTATGGGPSPSPVTGRGGLDVVPFPGTPDASTTTQIVFPTLAPAELRSVTVTGSRSGAHAGRLEALAAGGGAAFVPVKPFTAGERVSVSAVLGSREAGTAAGAAGATRLRYSFTVAVAATASASSGASSTAPAKGSGASTPAKPTQSFRSAPGLKPPAVSATSDPDTSSGDIFLTPNGGTQSGPMILDGKGRLVWFDPITNGTEAVDFAEQTYEGQPVLTWWQGKVSPAGYGYDGEDVILNSSYQTVATVRAGDGYSADLHEFQITPQGTALITAFVPVRANLSSVGGASDGTVLDSVIQEVDIHTGQVLWEWHALGHVPLTDSYAGQPSASAPYDYFHINSIQQLPNGNLLVSARNTWGVYEISRSTGKIVWELGGKSSSFKMGSGTSYQWQHDARLAADGTTLTLFDDAATPKEASESRGLVLSLDTKTMTASLMHAYTHTPAVLTGSQGSTQVLPDGDVFVGWGAEPEFSEYTAGGGQIFTASFTLPVASYRAFRFTWNGQPTTRPAIAAASGAGGSVTAYASWNGATDVARWQLLAGPTPTSLTAIAASASDGFQTAITASVPSGDRYVAAQAVSSAGVVLGVSAPVPR